MCYDNALYRFTFYLLDYLWINNNSAMSLSHMMSSITDFLSQTMQTSTKMYRMPAQFLELGGKNKVHCVEARLLSSVVCRCRAGFRHYFSMSPSFSVLSLHARLPKYVAFDSFPPSRWFTSHSVFSNFMQKSVVSQNVSNPSIFPLPHRVQYLPVFIYSF